MTRVMARLQMSTSENAAYIDRQGINGQEE